MRLCAQWSALSARVDRVLQSAGAIASGGKSFVVLEKEDWPTHVDADNYLQALLGKEGANMFQIGKSSLGVESSSGTKIPYRWIHSSGGTRLIPLTLSDFSRVYMVFGEGIDCLLFMRGLPLSVVVKANLQTIQRRIRKRVEDVPPDDAPNPDVDELWPYEDVMESCNVDDFLAARTTMRPGIAREADLCNSYTALHIDGRCVVLEFAGFRGDVFVGNFVLTYQFRTQSSEGWDPASPFG
jgi:hypothetical protein